MATLAASDRVAKDKPLQAEMNEGLKPRRGAFEIRVETDDGKVLDLWSGLALGPPRRLKFPEPEELLKLLDEKLDEK